MAESQLTDRAIKIIQDAQLMAQDHSHPLMTPLHLLAAMTSSDTDGAPPYLQTVIERARFDWQPVEREINRRIVRIPSQNPPPTQVSPNPAFSKVLQEAAHIRDKQKDSYIGQDHILLALLEDSSIQQLLKDLQIQPQALEKQITAIRGNRRIDSRQADSSDEFEFLKKYAIDMTTAAREGKIDPVIGREDEIRRCIRILSRRTKSNPCLIGDPGVGKTAIVEGVAQRIIDNDVPHILANCRLFSLDLGALKAGAKYQGDFEERVKGVLKEIEESKDLIILFIDEIHMLMGDGKSDAANLLKPMLARGTLKCIGATTVDEYRKYIKKDGAFERRFQAVDVKEPTVNETVAILRGIQSKYELHHGVRILDSALVTAATLASRYLTYRKLPDSAVDLIDESAASVAVARDSKPEQLDTLERQLQLLEVEIQALRRDASADSTTKDRLKQAEQRKANVEEELAPLRERYNQEMKGHNEINLLKTKLADLENKAQDADRRRDTQAAADLRYYAIPDITARIKELEESQEVNSQTFLDDVVDSDKVAETAAKLTGIPVSKLTQAENARLVNMEKVLGAEVVGQKEAVSAVANAIRRTRAGVGNPNTPPSFLFLGLSGSGKTELAKKLAGYLFSDEKAMIRIDCSELSDKWSSSKLVGAAPGYVGYEEGGLLTNALQRKPYSVVLFDEVEKASADVLTILLQVLDDGIIHAADGKLINCSNAIFIMTSNLGAQYIEQSSHTHVDAMTKAQVMEAVKLHFRPEFLNRISSTVVFNRLSEKAIGKIVKLRLAEIEQRFASSNRAIHLNVDEEAVKYLVEHGYSKDLGARPLNRLIQNEILNELAVMLLDGRIKDKENVAVVKGEDGLTVVPNHDVTEGLEKMDTDEDVSDSDEDMY